MPSIYRIHPSIGLARIGNSDEFYLAPEGIGKRPIECDQKTYDPLNEENTTTPEPVRRYKDGKDSKGKDSKVEGRIKKMAAKFRVFRYDDKNPQGVEINLEEDSTVTKIVWTVHLANKKAAWYEFSEYEGDLMFGQNNSYEHQNIPLRNVDKMSDEERRDLIIDPGPRTIEKPRDRKEFSKKSKEEHAQNYKFFSFPEKPQYGTEIESLGTMMTDSKGNLLVLGGNGDTGGDQPFAGFAGADSWHDDISDGPVTCTVYFKDGTHTDLLKAWVVVGPPGFAPEILNISTLDDLMFDVYVRNFNLVPELYDKSKYQGGWNPDYEVNFSRDIEPIIKRCGGYRWVANIPSMISFFAPSFNVKDNNKDENSEAYKQRQLYFSYFRNPGNLEEKEPGDRQTLFKNNVPMMPHNSGSNSVANLILDKFATLTTTQYFMLGQWARGKFNTNAIADSFGLAPLDRASVGNCVGIPMCPGIEVTWTTRNPTIYDAKSVVSETGPNSYMIKHRDPSEFPFDNYKTIEEYYAQKGLTHNRDETATQNGLEPGDLTKRMAIPWQADLYECNIEYVSLVSNQNMNDKTGIPPPPSYYIHWWPPEVPWHVISGPDTKDDVEAAGIPAGMPVIYTRGITSHMQMVQGWSHLGFILNQNEGPDREQYPYFAEKERNHQAFNVVSMSVDNVNMVFNPSNSSFVPVWFLKRESEFVSYG